MKVRFKNNKSIVGTSSKFNTSTTGEVIMNSEQMGVDSVFIRDLEVKIKGEWVDMGGAFANNDLITDNFNTCFFEPNDEWERGRGYRV